MLSRGRIIFSVLVIVGAGLMLVSWFSPWWICTVDAIYMLNQGIVMIRPWGLEQNLGRFASYVAGGEMPIWFAPFMWTYLAACMIALLAALVIKDRIIRFKGREFNIPQWLIGLVGVTCIICAVVAAVFAAIRTADFGINFIGYTWIIIDPHAGGNADLNASLQWGYFLMYGVGLMLIALAFFRNRILGLTGKKA